MTDDKKKCFCVVPIGAQDSPTRLRSDEFMEFIVEEVLGEAYEIERADLSPRTGVITNGIIQKVVAADLVVADMTGGNPNVFYELALRHVARKPVVQFIDAAERIPFDLAATNVIQFDIRSLSSVASAKKTLREQVAYLDSCPGEQIENPVSVAVDLQMLTPEEQPLGRQMQRMADTVAGLLDEFRHIKERSGVHWVVNPQWMAGPSVYGGTWDSSLSAIRPLDVGQVSLGPPTVIATEEESKAARSDGN